jgi:hypothetical protein
LRFLRLLAEDLSLSDTELHIVTGPAYRFGLELALYIGNTGGKNIIFTETPIDMANCMKHADMGIVSNG